MEDLGPNSDCGESESQIQKQGIILKLKYHFKEKLKKKEEWNHQSHQFNHLWQKHVRY